MSGRKEKIMEKEKWNNAILDLERQLENAIRRDRYHKVLHGNKKIDPFTEIFDLIGNYNESPENILIEKELRENIFNELFKALKELNSINEKDTLVLVKLFLYSETLETVANEMEVSISAVRKRKISALSKLRKRLLKENSEFHDDIRILFESQGKKLPIKSPK
jgi:DNA-directed RNA polymerase sigma subunit (sigma70/sigma32)